MLSVKLAHLLLLVYWLGADVGTYYASRFVADSSSTPAARTVAARIMLGVDMAPRLCMPLMLATGVQLAAMQGWLAWPPVALAASWGVCGAWLLMVLLIHHHGSSEPGKKLARFDFAFRVLVLASLLLLAGWSMLAGALPGWLAFKLFCFALAVACGLAIRMVLRPFGPAFALMASGRGTPEVDHTIGRAIARCKPFVWVIWALLVLSAAAGLHLFA
jgi:uncharacterized membrane protein